MSETVIGIDPSLTGLAVCVYDGNVNMHLFDSAAGSRELFSRFDRFDKLAKQVVGVVDSALPRLILIEGYSFGSRGSAVLTIAEFGGVLRDWLIAGIGDIYQRDNLPMFMECAPANLKKFVTGKGNADKTAMALGAFKRWGVEFQTNDEIDAYGLARMAACYVGWEEPANDKQREAIASLRGEKPAKKKKAS